MTASSTLGVHRKDVRMSPAQPGWWRGGWCAEDDLKALSRQHLDRLVQPAPGKRALSGFHGRPSELGDPDQRDAGLAHELGIYRPAFPRPLFGVVADT